MKKLFPASLIIIAALGIVSANVFLPRINVLSAFAQATSSETPYGGMRSYTLTCTCSGNSLLYIMDYRTNSILTLIYQAGASVLYSYYNIYGTYLLGTYSSTGNTCKIYVGEDCVDISSEGQMGSQPGTGTSSS